MARAVRKGLLETRTSRLKLPVANNPVYVRIGAGLSLGYRRTQTVGTWVVKWTDGKGGRATAAIGKADDFDDADNAQFFTFFEAQARAREISRSREGAVKPITVQVAVDNYLVWLTAKNGRTADDTRGRLAKHFLPKFGSKLVSTLTKTQIDAWLAGLVSRSDDSEKVRKSKDSANRVLSMVKAALNHAVHDKASGIKDDSAWRLVKPFHGVAKPREIRFTDAEVKRLLDSAADKHLRALLTGAFLTGARYGELIEARVSHFDERAQTLRVAVSKTGGRTIILQSSATAFFIELAGERDGNEYLFTRDGTVRWQRSDQARPVKLALKAAGLGDSGSIYALRHTYISRAIEGGVPLNIIAENCGTSVRMIEKTYAKVLAESRRAFIERGAPTL